MPSAEQLERAIWIDLCEEFPIFRTYPRGTADWDADLKATLSSIGVNALRAELLSTIDSQIVGERLRREAAKQLHSIEFVGIQELSDAEGDGPQEPVSDGLAVENSIVRIISSSMVLILIKPIELSRKLSMDARQRLLALKCVELVRKESRARGQWISEIDQNISDSFPQDPRTGVPFEVKVEMLEPYGFPFYVLHLPSPGSADDGMYIKFGTEAKYGKD